MGKERTLFILNVHDMKCDLNKENNHVFFMNSSNTISIVDGNYPPSVFLTRLEKCKNPKVRSSVTAELLNVLN